MYSNKLLTERVRYKFEASTLARSNPSTFGYSFCEKLLEFTREILGNIFSNTVIWKSLIKEATKLLLKFCVKLSFANIKKIPLGFTFRCEYW